MLTESEITMKETWVKKYLPFLRCHRSTFCLGPLILEMEERIMLVCFSEMITKTHYCLHIQDGKGLKLNLGVVIADRMTE